MPDATPPRKAARQAEQHLAALQAAGVEYVPADPPEPPAEPPRPAAEAPEAVTPAEAAAAPPIGAGSLFADAEASEEAALTPEERRRELTVLAQRVSRCLRCDDLASTRSHTVFGVGPVHAEVCFVGEAPGADEDRTGEPFVGVAGQMLNRILAACGLRREDVFITNVIRCRPPGNRQPAAEEAANCREYLERTLELVRPKVIVALGATAAKHLLDTGAGISKLRGKWRDYRGTPLLCTYHPAALLPGRSPELKRDVWEDMKVVLARLGRPVPTGKKGEG